MERGPKAKKHQKGQDAGEEDSQQLKDFAKAKGLSMKTKFELENLVVNKMTLMAAVKLHREGIPKTSILPRATAALTGFRKLDPPQGRPPLPCPMMAAIVRKLWQVKSQVAMWILLVWATCCRRGEAVKVAM